MKTISISARVVARFLHRAKQFTRLAFSDPQFPSLADSPQTFIVEGDYEYGSQVDIVIELRAPGEISSEPVKVIEMGAGE
jgi:hypothetical protein